MINFFHIGIFMANPAMQSHYLSKNVMSVIHSKLRGTMRNEVFRFTLEEVSHNA